MSVIIRSKSFRTDWKVRFSLIAQLQVPTKVAIGTITRPEKNKAPVEKKPDRRKMPINAVMVSIAYRL